MKAILKNFWYVLTRFKTSSLLNIIGLSVAIFVFLVVAIQVYFDTTFNTSFEKTDKIYQVTKLEKTEVKDSYIAAFGKEEMELLIDKFPEITNYCMVQGGEKKTINLKDNNGNESEHEANITMVSEGFIDMFTPRSVEGNLNNLLSDRDNAIISKKTARRMFGNESPIGKHIMLPLIKIEVDRGVNVNIRDQSVTIVAVYDDFEENISFTNGFFVFRPMEKYLKYNQTYWQVESSALAKSLEEKLSAKEIVDQLDFAQYYGNQDKQEQIEKTNEVKILPIKNIHTNYPDVTKKGRDIKSVYFFIAIGLFILLIAYINFINFSTAMAPARVRSINIQKILGANVIGQRLTLISEAVCFTIGASAIALTLLFIFQGSNIAQMFTAPMAIAENTKLIIVSGLCLCALSAFIGIYPAFYITTFNTAVSINSTNSGGLKNTKLRNLLLVVQFFAAILLIILALFVKLQHEYLVNYSSGIDSKNVIFVETIDSNGNQKLNTDIKTFISEVMQTPTIESYTRSSTLPNEADQNTFMRNINGDVYAGNQMFVTQNFLQFFGIEVVEGLDLNVTEQEGVNSIVLNQKFLKNHNIENGLTGLLESSYGKRQGVKIVGIVKDFHYSSLLGDIGSLQIMSEEMYANSYAFFKIANGQSKEAIQHINDSWKKCSSKNIKLEFMDENTQRLYSDQENLALIISIVSIMIILIAIMGVYGIITFNTRYRSKEMAIRKVNGAEEWGIVLLLNKSILIQFCISVILAIPASYFVVDKWMMQFPYKIDLHWWVFAVGLLIILLITIITVSTQSWRAAIKNPVDSLKSE